MKSQGAKLLSAHIDQFEKCQSQIEGLYAETGQLAKKSPNGGVNKFKLTFFNQTLEPCNELFGDHYKPFADVSLFSDEELPTTSDVVMMLAQYALALEKFQGDHVAHIEGSWRSLVSDGAVITTTIPKNLVARRHEKK